MLLRLRMTCGWWWLNEHGRSTKPAQGYISKKRPLVYQLIRGRMAQWLNGVQAYAQAVQVPTTWPSRLRSTHYSVAGVYRNSPKSLGVFSRLSSRCLSLLRTCSIERLGSHLPHLPVHGRKNHRVQAGPPYWDTSTKSISFSQAAAFGVSRVQLVAVSLIF